MSIIKCLQLQLMEIIPYIQHMRHTVSESSVTEHKTKIETDTLRGNIPLWHCMEKAVSRMNIPLFL